MGRIFAEDGKVLATNEIKSPPRALEITSNIATAAATKRAALSSWPEVINFQHTGRGLYLEKFVKFMLYKWKKQLIH